MQLFKAHPIITRWRRDDKGEIYAINGKKQLQMIVVQRKDAKTYEIPWNFCLPGEKIWKELKKELLDGASLNLDDEEKNHLSFEFDILFTTGIEVYFLFLFTN